jgi:ribosome modulation factor
VNSSVEVAGRLHKGSFTHTEMTIDRNEPVLRAYDEGVEEGTRGASPGECPFREQSLRDAWLTGCVYGRTGVARPKPMPIRDAGAWSSEGGPSLRSTSAAECSLCGQLVTASEQVNDAREIEMFGAARYAWCPLCRRKVEPPWSNGYKKRWNRFVEGYRKTNR